MRYALKTLPAWGLLMAVSVAAARADEQQPKRPAHEGKILVLPFTGINAAENQKWLGRSIQQSLAADLTMAAPGRVITSDREATDTAAAVDAGKQNDAVYVVTGSFTSLNTTAGQGLRLMGQIIDVYAGAPTGAFKSTGMSGEVFRLEDQIGMQIRHELASTGAVSAPPPVAEAPPAQPQSQSSEQVATAYQQPNPYYQAYSSTPNYVPAENNYNYYYSNPGYYGGYYGYPYGYYPYAYGYWGWPWWWWGGTVIISNGFHDHNHDHVEHHGHWTGGNHWANGGGGGGMHMAGGGMHMAGGGMHMAGGGMRMGGGGVHMGGGGMHMGGGMGGHR
jgi:TolB-like protein